MRTIKTILKSITIGLLLLFAAAALALAHARYIAPYDLKVESREIRSAHIAPAADGLRIVIFADTHLGPYYDLAAFEKVIAAINGLEPDLVLFAGDLIDDFDSYGEDPAHLSTLLAGIDAAYGKYCVFGNHDYGGGAERYYPDIMKNGGFMLLVNESRRLDALGIDLIGIDDILIGYGDPSVAGAADAGRYNIVIAHEPDIADLIIDSDVDLILSAHTHGRQVDIPFSDDYLLPPYGKNYVKGLYEFPTARKTKLYVNRGIGVTQLPLRFRSSPELTLLVLGSGAAVASQ